MSWSEGYVSEIQYFYGYSREASPFFQGFALSSLGVRPPAQAARCLELGFGKGVSMNVHAAAQQIEYWGTDFIPGQAAEAAEWAEACGNGAHIHDESFAEFAQRRDLPQFDYIALNGVWAWISPENKQHIVALLKKHLKPGGVFYVTYNTVAGWGARIAARDLIALHADRVSPPGDGVLRKMKESLAFLQRLFDKSPRFVQTNPKVIDWLKGLRSQDPVYLAHEYLNQYWQPQSFVQVQTDLAEAKLTYAGSADLMENFDWINIAPKAQELLIQHRDPLLNETIRDFCLNRIYRRDLFVRGKRELTTADSKDFMHDSRFVLLSPPGEISLVLNRSHGQINLAENIYRPLLDFLGDEVGRPHSFAAVQKAVAGPGLEMQQIFQALNVLVGMRKAAPAQSARKAESSRVLVRQLNSYLCERAACGAGVNLLASPVTGGGIVLDQFQQLFLFAIDKGYESSSKAAPFLWTILKKQNKQLARDGKALRGDADNVAELQSRYEKFRIDTLPRLRRLEVTA